MSSPALQSAMLRRLIHGCLDLTCEILPKFRQVCRKMPRHDQDLQMCSSQEATVSRRKLEDSRQIIYFTKTMTTNMVKANLPRLDIPAKFVREHGDKFQETIILERHGGCGENWPVRLRIQHREEGGVRVYCCNSSESAWRDFVVKNQLNIGDVLLFNLVAMSRFVVHVNPEFDELDVSFTMELIDMKSSACCSCFEAAFNCRENSRWKRVDVLDYLLKPLEDLLCTCDHHHHHDQSGSKESARKPLRFQQRRDSQPEVKNFSERVPQRNGGARIHHEHFRTVSKSSRCRPEFVKELCQTHVEGSRRSPINGARLEIPQSFVRVHRKQIHRMIKLEFQDSQVTWVMRSSFHETKKNKDRLLFGCGWRSFCDDNELRMGDRLRFTLIKPSHFLVQLLGSQKIGLPQNSSSWSILRVSEVAKVLMRVLSASPTKTLEQHQSSEEFMHSLCKCVGRNVTDDVGLVYVCPILFTTWNYENSFLYLRTKL